MKQATLGRHLRLESTPSARVHGVGMTDRELLTEFQATGSAEVFAQIAERHSAMVYSTCLRVLKDPHAAEDAAQAAFLVLLRKRGSIGKDAILPAWLYLTAQACARDANRSKVRRTRHERIAPTMPISTTTTDPSQSAVWREVKDHLDDALATLPAPQRDAIVLRYLNGYSVADAAREAGCPERTLHNRVMYGLTKLRDMLSKRGVAVTSIALGTLLAQRTVEAAPAALASTLTTACLAQVAPAGAATAVGSAKAATAIKAATTAKAAALAANTKLAIAAVVLLGVSVPAVYALKQAKSAPVEKKPAIAPMAPVSARTTLPDQASSLGLPPGSTVLYQRNFDTKPDTQFGEWLAAPGLAGNFAIRGAPRPVEDLPFFCEVRTGIDANGWSLGKRTYLRFRYFARGFGEKETMKLMLKPKDENNYIGYLKPITNDQWQTVTVHLNSDIVFVWDNKRNLSEVDRLHCLVWLGHSESGSVPKAELWIDDVVLFESPVDVPAVKLRTEP
jgi:RNA polymerase sigma factor (sigma-70 family)